MEELAIVTTNAGGGTAVAVHTVVPSTRIDSDPETAQLEPLFHDSSQDLQLYDETKIAADALREWCEKVSQETSTSKSWKFRTRESTKAQANKLISQSTDDQITEVKSMIDKLETAWQKKHSKVYHSLTNACKTLHSHKEIFSIFPSQNLYASVVCGTLSIFVQASVNHDAIAETLSKTVEEISTKVALCANIIKAITTKSMKSKLAEVYTKMFGFYSDIMEWYLASRLKRFFGSFNEDIKKKFESAAKKIDLLIGEMYNEAKIGGFAMGRTMINQLNRTGQFLEQGLGALQLGLEDIKVELSKNREEQSSGSWPPPGIQDQTFQALLLNFNELVVDQRDTKFTFRKTVRDQQQFSLMAEQQSQIESAREPVACNEETTSLEDCITKLEEKIRGEDCTQFLSNQIPTPLEDRTRIKLQNWLQTTREAQLLWLECPFEYQPLNTAKKASLAVIRAAFESKIPFIAHFCEKNQRESGSSDGNESALVGFCYRLIKQLLQFQPTLSKALYDRVATLDGTYQSWSIAISLLTELLQTTKVLQFCVIHGITLFDKGDDAKRCQELLDVLLEHQKPEKTAFSILFTTSGQCRLLAANIPSTNRYRAPQNLLQAGKRGQRLGSPNRTR